MKYLIIGGSAAGTSAAEIIRQKDAQGEITIVDAQGLPFYTRIPLADFVAGKKKEETLFKKSQNFYKENRINLIKGEATALDIKNKTIKLEDGQKLSFDQLLLAMGGTPRKLEVPGAELEGIYHLYDLADAKAVEERLNTIKTAASNAVGAIIGGGFLGIDFVNGMLGNKVKPVMIVKNPYYLFPLMGDKGGEILDRKLQEAGVELYLNEEVREIRGNKGVEGSALSGVEGVVLKSGKEIPCQMLGVAIGIDRNIEWLKDSGLEINQGILVNEYLETYTPGVYAAGDVAEFKDLVTGATHTLGNESNAVSQGKIAGANMTGEKNIFRMVSSYTVDAPGVHIAFQGDLNAEGKEEIIRQKGDHYLRFLLKDGKLTGAVLLNSPQDLGKTLRLILQKVDLSDKMEMLKDPSRDLSELF